MKIRTEPECLWNFWRIYYFDSKLEDFYKDPFSLSQFKSLFGNYYFKRFRKLVSNVDYREDLCCEWCGEVKPTSVSEVWSQLYPVSCLRRLCNDCDCVCGAG